MMASERLDQRLRNRQGLTAIASGLRYRGKMGYCGSDL